jgi:hypothetical protein
VPPRPIPASSAKCCPYSTSLDPAQFQPSDSEIDVPNQMSQLRGLLLDDLSVACELKFCCKRNVGSPFRGDITTSDTSEPQVLIVKAWTWLGLHCRTLFSVLTGNQSLDLSMSSTTATSQRLPPEVLKKILSHSDGCGYPGAKSGQSVLSYSDSFRPPCQAWWFDEKSAEHRVLLWNRRSI